MHPAVLLGLIGIVLWLERRRPLRRAVDASPRRLARNVAIGAVTAGFVAAIERPLIRRSPSRRSGSDGASCSA